MAHYLITGHTGFKGAWLISLLKARGHEVSGIALDPLEGSLFSRAGMADDLVHDYRLDIRDYEKTISAFRQIQPDYVIHMAAQALVREGYRNPVYTYDTNVNGTLNILRCVDETDSVGSHLVVTTDKVYLNQGLGRPYQEGDPLGGKDPYSASKAMADILAQEWLSRADAKPGAIARAGNVIGAGDVARDRLIPDFLAAARAGVELRVRNPLAVRPWQHVLDCLNGYTSLLDLVGDAGFSGAWNFGPSLLEGNLTVAEVISIAQEVIPHPTQVQTVPDSVFSEESFLALNADKANSTLKWTCRLGPKESVEWAVVEAQGGHRVDIREVIHSQVQNFSDRRSVS